MKKVGTWPESSTLRARHPNPTSTRPSPTDEKRKYLHEALRDADLTTYSQKIAEARELIVRALALVEDEA